jgi:sugar lactone lactonase YvrE
MRPLVTTIGVAEAPCFVGGELWFTDLFVGVLRVSEGGRAEVLVDGRRGVGGLVPHVSGGVVASGRSIVHVAPDASVTEMVSRPPAVVGWNDLHTTVDGNLLAGGLTYRPLAGESPRPGLVLEIGPIRAREVLAGPTWPNGIVTSPDGGTCYIADYDTGRVLAADSRSGETRVLTTLAEGHADGMAVDRTGCLWVATGPGRTIVVVTPEGVVERRTTVPADFAASIALHPQGEAVVAVAGYAESTDGALLAWDVDTPGVAVTPCALPPAGERA